VPFSTPLRRPRPGPRVPQGFPTSTRSRNALQWQAFPNRLSCYTDSVIGHRVMAKCTKSTVSGEAKVSPRGGQKEKRTGRPTRPVRGLDCPRAVHQNAPARVDFFGAAAEGRTRVDFLRVDFLSPPSRSCGLYCCCLPITRTNADGLRPIGLRSVVRGFRG
jgi:hypothetical protein